jgi:hypothetical protein
MDPVATDTSTEATQDQSVGQSDDEVEWDFSKGKGKGRLDGRRDSKHMGQPGEPAEGS